MAPFDKQRSIFDALTSEPAGKVGLKGILRGAEAQAAQPSGMYTYSFPEFRVQGREAVVKPKEDKTERILSLEAQVASLELKLAKAKSDTPLQVATAHTYGKAEGLAQGLLDGEQAAASSYQKQLEKLQADLGRTLQAMNLAYGTRVKEIEAQVVELSLGIAKRIFSAEAENNPDRISKIIAEGFSHLGQAETVVLHLNPFDVSYAQESQSFWQPMHSSLKSVKIHSDLRVERGGCWIESEGGGTIDLRTNVIWERIEQAVREAVSNIEDLPPEPVDHDDPS